jgi:hypothetical protein
MGLFAPHPEIFISSHGVDLPGIQVGANKSPNIQHLIDFSIDARAIDVADSNCGSASCVRSMIIVP